MTIGYYDAEPSCWQDAAGKPQGIFIELFEQIAAENGWRAKWVFGAWDDLLTGLQAGSIEIVPAIVHTKPREAFALFSSETVMLDWGSVLVARGSDIRTILDLGGKKVGYLRNDFWFEGDGALSEQIRAFGLGPEYVSFDRYGDLFAALGWGDIDAAAGSNTLALVNGGRYGIMATPIIYNPVELTFAVSRFVNDAETLRQGLDDGIARIKTRDPDRLGAILARHAVPVRSELVLPRWAVLVMVFSILLLTLFLVVFALQSRGLARANRALKSAVRKTRQALDGKDAYLHETQHRVRNNLQLVVSLLRLEADRAENPKAQAALQVARSRVLAMASVQEIVHDSGDLGADGFTSFLGDLVSTLAENLGSERLTARYHVDLAGETLPVGAATPLALIVHELAPNACLYGAGADGRVDLDIKLERQADGARVLTVQDRGRGFPPDFSLDHSGGLGFTLIQALASQINGSVETTNSGGAVVRLRF